MINHIIQDMTPLLTLPTNAVAITSMQITVPPGATEKTSTMPPRLTRIGQRREQAEVLADVPVDGQTLDIGGEQHIDRHDKRTSRHEDELAG